MMIKMLPLPTGNKNEGNGEMTTEEALQKQIIQLEFNVKNLKAQMGEKDKIIEQQKQEISEMKEKEEKNAVDVNQISLIKAL